MLVHGSAHTQIATFKYCFCSDRFLSYWPFENSWLDASAWVIEAYIPSQGMVTSRLTKQYISLHQGGATSSQMKPSVHSLVRHHLLF